MQTRDCVEMTLAGGKSSLVKLVTDYMGLLGKTTDEAEMYQLLNEFIKIFKVILLNKKFSIFDFFPLNEDSSF